MRDTTYDPDNPLRMGPDARSKEYRWAGVDRPEMTTVEEWGTDLRVDEATAACLPEHGARSVLGEALHDMWVDHVEDESGRWGAVAVLTTPSGETADFMTEDPTNDHDCERLVDRANRISAVAFLDPMARVLRRKRYTWTGQRPKAYVADGMETVKERTWEVRGGFLIYDPTHTRTVRVVAHMRDNMNMDNGLIDSDFFNELEHENTERLFIEHIQETLKGSPLADDQELEDKLRQLISDREATWCPQCHDLDYDAPAALDELGYRICYGCGDWFHPNEWGDGRFVCTGCLDDEVDAEEAGVNLIRKSARKAVERLRRRDGDVDSSQETAALVAARMVYPLPGDREFGAHEADKAVEYWRGQMELILRGSADLGE